MRGVTPAWLPFSLSASSMLGSVAGAVLGAVQQCSDVLIGTPLGNGQRCVSVLQKGRWY